MLRVNNSAGIFVHISLPFLFKIVYKKCESTFMNLKEWIVPEQRDSCTIFNYRKILIFVKLFCSLFIKNTHFSCDKILGVLKYICRDY